MNNGDIVTQKNLFIGLNTNEATSKSIFFGGTLNDNSYLHTVIENRIYELGTEKANFYFLKVMILKRLPIQLGLEGQILCLILIQLLRQQEPMKI